MALFAIGKFFFRICADGERAAIFPVSLLEGNEVLEISSNCTVSSRYGSDVTSNHNDKGAATWK
jgi:hypothetical protein